MPSASTLPSAPPAHPRIPGFARLLLATSIAGVAFLYLVTTFVLWASYGLALWRAP